MIPAGLFLADTSALARARHPTVSDRLEHLGRARLLATCPPVDLEVGFSARSAAEHTRIAALRAEHLHDLPLTRETGPRVRRLQARLAAQGMLRAVGVVDLLVSAVALERQAVVLHYDEDFEHVAAVSDLQQQWVVPRGSIP